jgi:hypothetical protein
MTLRGKPYGKTARSPLISPEGSPFDSWYALQGKRRSDPRSIAMGIEHHVKAVHFGIGVDPNCPACVEMQARLAEVTK